VPIEKRSDFERGAVTSARIVVDRQRLLSADDNDGANASSCLEMTALFGWHGACIAV
jgi:hypothetical protein